jgi:hypothetical protein
MYDRIYKQLIENFKKIENNYDFIFDDIYLVVKEVDGEMVRDEYDTEFVGGGHHLVYDYVPTNEIWIENKFSKDDKTFFTMHEIFEYLLMKFKNKNYDAAHNFANHYEEQLRQNNPIEKVDELPIG